MSEYINCLNCGEEVTTDSDFCPHCGIIFTEAGKVFCDEHSQKPATGVCIICRKVFCEECGTKVSGRRFCLLHKKVKVQQDWAEVFRSTEISDAELVKSVLESTGHKVQVQNFRSIGFAWEGGGDSAVSRSNMNSPAKVFVPIPEYIEAIKEIAEWKSKEPDINPDEAEYEE